MDLSVLHKLTYGMYAVGTLDGIRPAGCIVNTVIQVTSDNSCYCCEYEQK